MESTPVSAQLFDVRERLQDIGFSLAPLFYSQSDSDAVAFQKIMSELIGQEKVLKQLAEKMGTYEFGAQRYA